MGIFVTNSINKMVQERMRLNKMVQERVFFTADTQKEVWCFNLGTTPVREKSEFPPRKLNAAFDSGDSSEFFSLYANHFLIL